MSVNGARERNNNLLLDGVDNIDTSRREGSRRIEADPDSTEEFRVITNSFTLNTAAIPARSST